MVSSVEPLRIIKSKIRVYSCGRSPIWAAFIVLPFMLSFHSYAGWFDDSFSSGGYATGGGEYLKLPVHAQCAGLEAATVAWRENLAGLQYNPAILDAANSLIVIGTNSFLTLDRTSFGADIAAPVGNYFVSALSFSQLKVGKMEGRDDAGGFTENFNSSFNAISAVIAGRVALPLSFGLRVRYLFETIEKEHSNGMGFDIGATYQPIKQICIGTSLQNIASYLWWSTGHRDGVLMAGRLGICGKFIDSSIKIEMDFVKTMHQPEEGLFGAEYTFLKVFSARAGVRSAVNTGDRAFMKPEYSLGAGMQYDFLGFDYALVIPPNELGFVHKITVTVNISGY